MKASRRDEAHTGNWGTMKGVGAVLGAMFGAIGDVFGRPLRNYLLITAFGAAAALAVATWAAIAALTPYIDRIAPMVAAWRAPWLTAAAEIFADFTAIVIAIVLWPAVSLLIGGMQFERAAERIEHVRFPADPPGRKIPLREALGNSLKLAGPALALNAAVLPLLVIPGINLVAFVLLNAALMRAITQVTRIRRIEVFIEFSLQTDL